LERIKQIDAIIADENEEYEKLFEIASGFGGGFSIGERVQSSKNLQKMPDAVGAYMEVEKRIKALKRERQEIIDTIRTLPTNEYKILYKLFVKEPAFLLKELPDEFGMSYDWVKKTKRKALEHLQAILDEKKG
jgi:DNA-directed RNA polymerase specialized sigma subunit